MNVLVILNYFDRDGGTSKTFTEGKYLAALERDIITVKGWVDDPLADFAAADVVLGVGRCVLEALASGRPVLVVGNERIGGWVTEANFLDLQKADFSGCGSDTAVNGENLSREFLNIPGETTGLERIRTMAGRDRQQADAPPVFPPRVPLC